MLGVRGPRVRARPPAAGSSPLPDAARGRRLRVPRLHTALHRPNPVRPTHASPAPPLRSPRSTPTPNSHWPALGCTQFCRVWAHVSSSRLCSPPRRSSGFWRPWVDAPGEQEEAPHQAEKGVSEPRVAGRASERRRWFTRTGNTRPDGDTRPACPLLKSTPASRPAGGLVSAGEASVLSRAIATQGSDPE